MILRRSQARAHRIDAQVGCAERAPAGYEIGPAGLGYLPNTQPRLDAKRIGRAASRRGSAAQALEHRARLLVGRPLWHPAIAQPASTLDRRVDSGPEPDRDGSLDRQRIDAGLLNCVPAPFERHHWLGP